MPRDLRPCYVPEGDCLIYWADERPCTAERVDEMVTLYIADDGSGLVGFEIKDITRLLEQYGSLGVELVRKKNILIGILLTLAGVRPAAHYPGVFRDPLLAREIELPEMIPA